MDPSRFCAAFPTGNSNGWMLWHYQTSDDPVEILHPDYFHAVQSWVTRGDWIAVNIVNADGVGYSAMLLIVQNFVNGVKVEKLGFQPTAFMPKRGLSDSELNAVIAGEELAGRRGRDG